MILVYYFFVAAISSLLHFSTTCMEVAKTSSRSRTLHDLPTDIFGIIVSKLVDHDIEVFDENIKRKAPQVRDDVLSKLNESYYSFSPSLMSMFEVWPRTISLMNQLNHLLFDLRVNFFTRAAIYPSSQFVENFLKQFDNKRVNKAKLYNAFYSLIATQDIEFTKDWETLFFAKSPNTQSLISTIPLGCTTLISHYSSKLNPNYLSSISGAARPYIHIAAILYNPYSSMRRRYEDCDKYLSMLPSDASLSNNSEPIIAELKKTISEVSKKKGLCALIDYILTTETNASGKYSHFIKKGRHVLLYYYLERRLYNTAGNKFNQAFSEGFLNQAVKKALKLSRYCEIIDEDNPHRSVKAIRYFDVAIKVEQFSQINALLFPIDEKAMILNKRKAGFLMALFQRYSVRSLLKTFPHFIDYMNQIEKHMQDLGDTHELFYLQHFNGLVREAKNFSTIFGKDFKALVDFLESKSKIKYYPQKK